MNKKLVKKVVDVKTAGFSIDYEVCVGSLELKAIRPNIHNFMVVFWAQEACPLRKAKKKQLSSAKVNLFWSIITAPSLAFPSISPICVWLAAMTNISPYTDGSTLSHDPPSYLTKKCIVYTHKLKGGKAVFAREVIEPGELIAVWNGQIMVMAELATLPDDIKHHAVQVEEGQYLAGGTPNEPPDFLNHSCEPNAGMSSQISIVALRRVFPGEEVNIDYAMCDGSAYDEFNCMCGSPLCRGRVSGDDWQKPELWKRYGNHFMPYLLRRIQNLNLGRNQNQNRNLALVKQEQGDAGRNVGAGGGANAPCAAPALCGANTRKHKLVSMVEVEGEL